MELFNFDEDTRRLQRSDDLWLFFALALPLTAVTLAIGWICVRKSKNQRKQDHNFDDSIHGIMLETIKTGGVRG
ncbi:hypothetical protein M438DRAFT_346889 [Aureobasidium pullulans EXF-150]|uniref:Uncharacterized protein n=1 Tax=Aureobasidium pullulans EXF-150 TaxID=1043002 RepID=A0A074Y706_AURPU|nr:uncharacterized protein M438DRAFT_346889 [Aureobasidium pullulans EXF-150]KEQ82631.1 hypothetical protein M438DRAFT_346889 [Aureobasidium pullulans EXF-150]